MPRWVCAQRISIRRSEAQQQVDELGLLGVELRGGGQDDQLAGFHRTVADEGGVTDDALRHLGGLTELRVLGLASTQCTGTGFAHLKGLKKLESVNFHFTPLNDDGLRAIAGVPISGRLWFAHTRFTDAGAAKNSTDKPVGQCVLGRHGIEYADVQTK